MLPTCVFVGLRYSSFEQQLQTTTAVRWWYATTQFACIELIINKISKLKPNVYVSLTLDDDDDDVDEIVWICDRSLSRSLQSCSRLFVYFSVNKRFLLTNFWKSNLVLGCSNPFMITSTIGLPSFPSYKGYFNGVTLSSAQPWCLFLFCHCKTLTSRRKGIQQEHTKYCVLKA